MLFRISFFYNICIFLLAVTEGSNVSTNMSSQSKQSPDNQTSLSSSTPTYISDFEDNTIPTATNPTVGVSMATTVGSGDLHTIKSSTKKDTATDHISEDISSEGDTLVDQHNNSQLDSTLQNGKRFVKLL